MRPRAKINLSVWLTLLVLVAVVPLALLAWLTLREITTSSQALLDQRQADTARALALAVDGEVHSWKAALAALAESRSIQPARMEEFYEEARHVGEQHDGWVVLTLASGAQVFNTLLPYGAPLQNTSSPETINAIFRDGEPIVSDLIWGKNAQRYLVAVAVPVKRNGKVIHCLTLNFSPDRLTRLLLRQQLPPSWVAAINDGKRVVVARSVQADARVGKPTVDWFATASRSAQSGIVTGPLTDGRRGQIAFQRLQEVPWVVALATPVAELRSTAPIWRFAILSACLGLGAIGMAIFAGRKILAPVSRLARAGGTFLDGTDLDLGPSSGIREIEELQHTVAEAWSAIQARDHQREEAAAALRQVNAELEVRVRERTAALAAVNEALQADIEKRARAEEAMRRQAQLLDLSHDAIIVWELGGVIEYWNEGAATLYGYCRDEAIGRHTHDLLATFHPQGMAACESELERVGDWRGELLHVTKDNRVVTVESRMVLVPRDDRRLVLETNRDITLRRQAEEGRRASADRLRLASTAAGLGVFEWRVTDDTVLWENDRMYEIFGRTREEGPLSHAALMADAIDPADGPGFDQAVRDAMRPDGVIRHACRIRRCHDGVTRWIELVGRFDLTADGRPFRLTGVVGDITDRKEAEREIQSLAKFPAENPHPVLRLDRSGVVLYANHSAAGVLQEWRCAVGTRAPDPWPEVIREAFARGSRPSMDVSCGDRMYSFSVAVVPEARYVNLYGSDITERKRAEETLQHTLAELRRSNQDLEQFAYVASHDLQEPLRMVAGFTQLLARRYGDRLDQDAKEFIGFAVDGATRMQQLIQDLLAYSRVTTRGAGPAPTDANGALQAALRNLQGAIQETGAVVTHDPLPMVRADTTQLVQVFQNLVGNALKFRGDASPRIHVAATSENDVWVFRVIDNGIGIDPQYFERIFQIFQRLHATHRYPGTGIGLALCKRVVERHGGRIWVESTPGQGATFFFTVKRIEE